MKSPVRVAVIGGGVVGCSVLYHLTKLGWRDVVLIERSELTSGSTWHAAGGFHTLNADTNIDALQGYTIQLYKELEAISGESCGLHDVGGLTIATDPDRMDYLKAERAKHRYMGLETELVGPTEVQALSPITNTEGIVGALYDPLDGHLDPAGTTNAYAKAARRQGAEIVLRNPVKALSPRGDGTWDVVTEQGTIHAEHVVNAAGLWAREVGAMAGVTLPLHPMEHQYLVTDDIPEVYERDNELPHVIDPGGETYLRQEGRGLVLGIYAGLRAVGRRRHRVGFRPRVAARRFGPHRRAPGGRVRPLPLPRARRHQAGHQRPLQVRAGRQSPGRAGAGRAGLLGGLRRHGRLQPGRRRRPDAGRMDGRGRAVARRLRHGRRPLRRFHDADLHAPEGRRELPAVLRHRLSERRAAGGAAAQHDPGLWPLAGAECRLRRRLRHGARELRRAGRRGALRGADVPPLQCLRRCGRGVPRRARGRRPQRDPQFRQVRGHRPGRRGLAQPPDGQPGAAGRPHGADADAEPPGAG